MATRPFGADGIAILTISNVKAFSRFYFQALTELNQPRGVRFKSIDVTVGSAGSGIRSKLQRGKFLIDRIVGEHPDFYTFTPDSIEKFGKTGRAALEQMLQGPAKNPFVHDCLDKFALHFERICSPQILSLNQVGIRAFKSFLPQSSERGDNQYLANPPWSEKIEESQFQRHPAA